MYHALLTNRYLTTRVIPFIAVAAVALCVALVIIVVSVMTGFLDLVRASGKTLIGDVVVSSAGRGLPHYEQLIGRLKKQSEVAAATPIVEGLGLLLMPAEQTEHVQYLGIDPESFAQVTGYRSTLLWKQVTDEQAKYMADDDPRRAKRDQILDDGTTLRDSRTGRPSAAVGIHVWPGNFRQKDGSYRPQTERQGHVAWQFWLPLYEVKLSGFRREARGGFNPEPRGKTFPVVNEFSSGVYLIDKMRVFIPLAEAQELAGLDEQQVTDPTELDADGLPKVECTLPPRVTQVLVRAAEGVTPAALREVVEREFAAFRDQVNAAALDDCSRVPIFGVSIKTWEEQQAQFIGPIEKERELMRTLFSIVYLVCAGLVLAIFWGIVHEKTRDIGILRSIGAGRAGIVWVFLRYGFIIGVIGSIVGLGLAFLVVRNINSIHDALGAPPLWLAVTIGALAVGAIAMTIVAGVRGRLMPLMTWALASLALVMLTGAIFWVSRHGGIVVWDPEIYLFTRIPNELDMETAIITMIGAVIFSLLGAMLPAAKAADTDPVQALRYE